MKACILLSASLLWRISFVSASTRFKLKDVTCSGGVFSKSSLKTTCGGDCDGGDTLTVQGTVTAKSSFDDEHVTVLPCVKGFHCFDNYKEDAGKICDWISSNDGSDCGNAGKYSVYKEVEIPREASKFNYNRWSFLVTVKVFVGDEDSCSQSANAYGASLMSAAGVALVGSLVWRRRRRISRTETGTTEDDGAGHFVEMRDSVRVGTIV